MRIVPYGITLAAIALSTSCSSAASSAPQAVSSSDQLKSALLASKGGETIRLEPGLYRTFGLKKGQWPRYSQTVIVKPADPLHPPVFSEPVVIDGAQNLTVEGLHFRLTTNIPSHQPVVRVANARNVSFEDNIFEGNRSESGHYGHGLVAADVTGLRVLENEFAVLNRAFVGSKIRSLTLHRNDVRDIGHDGFSLSDVSGTITENLIEEFYPRPKYHPDGIQFHANRQAAARNVLLQNNLIIGHPDRRIQGIFMRAGYASDPTARYRNIRILDNIVIASMWNGIAVGQVEALEISGNRVLHVPGNDRMQARISTRESTGRVARNVAPRFLLSEGIIAEANRETEDLAWKDVEPIKQGWLARFRARD